MKENEKDLLLSKKLNEGTQKVLEQKENVRQSVLRKIACDEKGKYNNMKKRRPLWIKFAGAAAVVALIAGFLTFTPSGNAVAAGIAKFFVPEKSLVFEIEGTQETHDTVLEQNTSKEIGYVIYIDDQLYHKETIDGVDYIKVNDPVEDLPPVQMEISQLEDIDAETKYYELLAEAQANYADVLDLGQVTEPVEGWGYVAYDHSSWDMPYEDTYVVDNTNGGCFVIRCLMFTEAAEGHGARFYNMLTTFEIVNSDELK